MDTAGCVLPVFQKPQYKIRNGEFSSAADPDLSDGGGGGEGGHPDPEIRGGPVSKKVFFILVEK